MDMRTLTNRHLEDFEKQLRQNEKSEATIEKYLRDAKYFLNYTEEKEVTKEMTAAYKEYLVKKGYAPRSINSMLASVNSLLACLGWTECQVKHVRIQRQLYCREELTKEEYFRLLKAAGDNTRLNLILQTICSTGIRISELQYFTAEAVRLGEVNIQCKGKTRTILIPGKMRKKLQVFASSKGITAGPVFVSKNGKPLNRSCIWLQMKKLCAAAKVDPAKVFPHNLRKLFARTFYRMSRDLARLADVLGHCSIETTRIYIMETGSEHRRRIDKLALVV